MTQNLPSMLNLYSPKSPAFLIQNLLQHSTAIPQTLLNLFGAIQSHPIKGPSLNLPFRIHIRHHELAIVFRSSVNAEQTFSMIAQINLT